MFSSDLVLIGHGNFVEFFLNIFLFSFFTYLFFLFLLSLFFFDWQRWATILKYFLSLWKYSFCCFWYCWYLCSIFSKYFFNLLFSFTTESLIFKTLFFLAQCSIFFMLDNCLSFISVAYSYSSKFFSMSSSRKLNWFPLICWVDLVGLNFLFIV